MIVSLESKYLNQLKALVLKELKGEKVKVILFGSRARKSAGKTSDVDVGLIPHEALSRKKISSLKEKVADLNIPYTVDIVNIAETNQAFQQEVLKDAIIWKD